MLFVKLVRSNPVDGVYAHSVVAGPFDDDVDAQYRRKQLAAVDPNRDSSYSVVDCQWVVVVKRRDDQQVISWHEDEEDCKANAAATQRGDYSVVVEPMTYTDFLLNAEPTPA